MSAAADEKRVTPAGPSEDAAPSFPFSDEVKADWKPRRKLRASIVTRMVGNLQRESQKKGSWVTGILFLDKNPGFDKVQELLADRLLRMPRFRAAMRSRFGGKLNFRELAPEEFDMDYHLREVQVREDGATPSEADVIHYVEHMYKGWVPDMKKPLWQIDFVPEIDDGRACVVTKISHTVGDGVSQIEVLLRLLDPPEEGEDEEARRKRLAPPGKRAKQKSRFGPLHRARYFMAGVWNGFFSPFAPPDPTNSLRAKSTNDVSEERRFAFTPKISLERIRAVKAKLEGATVNDVFVAVMALSLREYFRGRDEKKVLSGRSKYRAQFPISTRTKREGPFRDGSPRNKWAYGSIPLPVSEKGSALRVFQRVQSSLQKVKLSPQPLVQTRVAKSLIPILPLKALNDTALKAANSCSAQLSSVAGPKEAVTLAGATVTDLSFVLFSPVSFYYGFLSYNGQVSAALCLDAALGVDPDDISKHFVPQFEALESEVMAHDGVIPQPTSCLDCL